MKNGLGANLMAVTSEGKSFPVSPVHYVPSNCVKSTQFSAPFRVCLLTAFILPSGI